jgi:glycosyltransferase involved in cell wall biosynthesis
MRVLVISNFYPPHAIGGYERGCHDVVNLLGTRGHEVMVLTSWLGLEGPSTDGPVKRWLQHLPMHHDALSRRALAAREISAQRAFDDACRDLRPDVIFLWNLARVPMSLAHRAEARGPVCYYVSDAWLANWTEPGWYGDPWFCVNRRATHPAARLGARAARAWFKTAGWTWTTEALRLTDVLFCSAFMKHATLGAGRPVDEAGIVHWGVDVSRFSPRHRDRVCPPSKLLFVGQVLPEKGVHTVIEALGRLHRDNHRNVTLTVVGACHQAEYVRRLANLVAEWNLGEAVQFTGAQPRERLPSLYAAHDVLVFPSCWDEPCAITPLEAMASGLTVVGTPAGGGAELFQHERNALTFSPGDAEACAAELRRVTTDPILARALACRGVQTIRDRFTLDGMVDRLEEALRVASARGMNTSV